MKLKGNLTIQNAVLRLCNSIFEHLHALGERLSKTFFFFGKNRLNFRILDFRIGFTHFCDHGIHQSGKEGFARTELIAVTDSATANTAKHISATFVARQNTISNRERAGANMVGDHLQRGTFGIHIGSTGFFNGFLYRCQQILKEVNFIVAVNVLQHSSDTFKTHACIHGRLRQFVHHTVFVTVKLHEHQVPNFDITVTVFVWASRRAALNFFTVVVKNF